MGLAHLAFLLHATIETAAALSFLLRPTTQLAGASAEAKLILRSYGGLLLATAQLSVLFFARAQFDGGSRIVALCLASYHLWPAHRAWSRLQHGISTSGEQGRVFGGPAVHLAVHVLCLVALLSAGILGGDIR